MCSAFRRGAAGEQHLLGIDGDAIGLRIMAGDPRLERGALPIAHRILVEDPVGCGDRCARRAGRGLAELHVDDRPALRREAVREAADRNGVKGIDRGGHRCGLSRA
jgi:hypothetical protein